MTDISELLIDVDAEEAGVWESLGIGDLEVKLRSPHSKTFRRAKEMAERPHQNEIRRNKLSEESQINIMIEAVVRGAVVDWRNFQSQGEELECTLENKLKIFSRNYRTILEGLLAAFARVEVRAVESKEEAEKN